MIKINSIEVYQVDIPIKEGKYNWSHGNSVSVFDSTVVKIKTNQNIIGLGEVCTLGSAYLPAYPEGVFLAILLMNVFAPTIDHYVVEANVKNRLNRLKIKSS